MKKKNFTDYSQLESYYIAHVLDYVQQNQKSAIVWEEVFQNHVKLAPATIVNVWKEAVNCINFFLILALC